MADGFGHLGVSQWAEASRPAGNRWRQLVNCARSGPGGEITANRRFLLPFRNVRGWYTCACEHAVRCWSSVLPRCSRLSSAGWRTGVRLARRHRSVAPESPPAASDSTGSRPASTSAADDAAAKGATISVAVLDRATGQQLTGGTNQLVAIASVAKLFIADDLLCARVRRPALLDRSPSPGQHAAVLRRWRGGELLGRARRQHDHQRRREPLRVDVHHPAQRRAVVEHDELGLGPGALLRRAAQRGRRPGEATAPRSSSTTSPDRRPPGPTAIRSDSASPMGSTANRSPSSRAGCAAWTAAVGCTCPPASSAPTGATSW